jgi:type I restriction enzyme S subunit
VKTGWRVAPLGEVCTLQRGYDLPTARRISGRFPLVTSSGPTDTHNEAKVKGPGVVTGRSGSIGSVFFVEQDFWPLNTALYVKNFHGNDPKFVWYLLQFFDLSRFASGAGVPTLNRNDVHGEDVSIPISYDEQKRIVAVLDEAFEGLDRARTNAEANLADARELFESFRFELMRPSRNGWTKRPLSECFRLKSGDNLTSKEMVTGEYPVYGGNGVAGFHNVFNLSGENIVVGRVGALCGNARHIDQDIWLTDNAFKLVDYKVQFDLPFLVHLLNFKNLRSLARQAAQPVISNSSLANLELAFPISVDDQAEISQKLFGAQAEVDRLQHHYREKMLTLTALRQSLLQKAFSGELT